MEQHKDVCESMSDAEMTVFEGPKWLIEATGEDFRVNDDTLQELRTIDKTLNVVSIVGLFRTGKSYLLTQLTGKDKGFHVSHKSGANTKGIWAWCVQHPVKKDQQLLLLDTEGLGNIRKGSKTYDNKIFTLVTLLSSTLIYNILGAFNNDALGNLSFVLELAKNIKTSEHKADVDGGQLDVYLPEFILLLRDSCLDFEVNGEKITAKEYLEHCLDPMPDEKEADAFNEPRLRLRKHFKRRNCFQIVVPASGKQLKKLDSLTSQELDKDYIKDLKTFLNHVLNQTEPFQTAEGHGINGRMFATLTKAYVDSISKGAVPRIDMTMQGMVDKENTDVVNMAFDDYASFMEKLELPTCTELDFVEVHKTAKAAAQHTYLDKCIMDKEFRAQKRLNRQINETYLKKKEANERLSTEGCQKRITELHKPIAEKIATGTYFVIGGLNHYEDDIKQIFKTYDACERMGFMKDRVGNSYLQQLESEKRTILDKDTWIKQEAKIQKLTEDAKKKEEEDKRMAKLANTKAKEEIKRLDKEYTEEIEKMKQKLKDDLKKNQERGDSILRQKTEEIDRLRKEGQAKEEKKALEDLERTKQTQAESRAWYKKFFDATIGKLIAFLYK